MKKLFSSALALVLAGACATTTNIVSEPPGAKVFDDQGIELGTTPYTFESSAWIWESKTVELKKAGYANKTVELSRNEIDVMPTVGSVALFICLGTVPVGLIAGGALFAAGGMKYPEETKVVLESGGAAPAPSPVPAPVPETPETPAVETTPETSALPSGLPIAMGY